MYNEFDVPKVLFCALYLKLEAIPTAVRASAARESKNEDDIAR